MRWRHCWLFVGVVCLLPTVRAVAADGERDLTVVVVENKVIGVGPGSKHEWQFDTDGSTVTSGQVLGKDRVLLALYGGNNPVLIEKDSTGKRLWVQEVGRGDDADVRGRSPIRGVQRLPDGSTLFAQEYRVVMVGPKGKETVIHRREPMVVGEEVYGIMDARRLPDGTIGILTADGYYRLLDAKGKESKSFRVGKRDEFGGSSYLEVMADGAILVSKWKMGSVEKFDADGKVVWKADVATPTSLAGLSNGNVLVASQTGKAVVELSSTGKLLWRYAAASSVSWAGR